jgi:hypothetical protein
MHKPRSPHHHNSLGTWVVADDLGHHRQGITKAQGMEEPEDPAFPPRHMIMKTMKKSGSIMLYSQILHHTYT